ncbi:LOW QUALITY PROTEIN: hypothetical protein ACHAW5_004861 [Stephanodiscus triporus]|uniref:Uncharacterized protein n=1 Tax=Stephanodiscus triporus TaxID=2934178 RepID=A0ABD3NG92_9STRA
MLHDFKDCGHCVTMDNTYMGNIMAMIGHDVWRINMVATVHANHTGTNIDCTKLMKKGTYKSICCWQLLCFAVWSDNALIQKLLNFHSLEILEAGIGRGCCNRRGMLTGSGRG